MHYQDLNEHAVNDETSVEFNLRQKKTAEAIKRLDKYYEQLNISYKNDEIITIDLYGSGSIGTLIRNAVTGLKENIIVGSSGEDLFFKVTDSTGRYGRKNPLMLYYNSPEEYEKHQLTTVDQSIKNQWNKKNQMFRRKMHIG